MLLCLIDLGSSFGALYRWSDSFCPLLSSCLFNGWSISSIYESSAALLQPYHAVTFCTLWFLYFQEVYIGYAGFISPITSIPHNSWFFCKRFFDHSFWIENEVFNQHGQVVDRCLLRMFGALVLLVSSIFMLEIWKKLGCFLIRRTLGFCFFMYCDDSKLQVVDRCNESISFNFAACWIWLSCNQSNIFHVPITIPAISGLI